MDRAALGYFYSQLINSRRVALFYRRQTAASLPQVCHATYTFSALGHKPPASNYGINQSSSVRRRRSDWRPQTNCLFQIGLDLRQPDVINNNWVCTMFFCGCLFVCGMLFGWIIGRMSYDSVIANWILCCRKVLNMFVVTLPNNQLSIVLVFTQTNYRAIKLL